MTESNNAAPSGRHRRAPAPTGGRPRRRRVVTAGVVGALVLTSAGVALAQRGSGGEDPSADTAAPCPAGVRTLDVLTAPAIAPVVAAAAERLRADCLDVTVTARRPGEVAAALRAGTQDLADVWIPDSTLWLRPEHVGSAAPEVRGRSLAASPVVLALTRRDADRLGWRRAAGFAGLVDAEGAVRLRLGNPRTSPATAGAVLGLEAAVTGRPDARGRLAGLLREAEPAADAADSDLAALPTAAGPEEPVRAVPTTEQAVWRHNTAGEAAAVVAAYPPPGGMGLDYPFTVLDPESAAGSDADRLRAALTGPAGAALVRAHGFRSPTGAPGPALTAASGVDPAAAAAATSDAAALERAVRTYEVLRRPGRMLAVIDVSGSMGEAVPGAGGATRLDLTREAAARGLGLLPDDTHVGLWIFSTYLDGDADHRELVPVAPLGPGPDGARPALAAALPQLRPGGDTALYDTTLAAVRAVRGGYDPDRVNSVVLLSDGRNKDERGLDLDTLLATLRKEAAAGPPVPVITIAYGPDSDGETLSAISAATGGATYAATDPRDIRAVFLDAIGQRTCRPDC